MPDGYESYNQKVTDKSLSQKQRIRDYYDTLRTERWKGEGRYAGYQPGRQIHLRQSALLGAVYMLRRFRTTEPRLLTLARYATAPIFNTTTLGKVAKTAQNVLRAGKSFGVGLKNNIYPDLPLDNPLKRVTNIFANLETKSKEIKNKYGLDASSTYEHGQMYENEGSITYKQEQFEDLIPVKFVQVSGEGINSVTQVRGAITAISDTISPTWNETTYVGRPDAFLSYGGYSREVSFTLTLAAMNELQLVPMWQKINHLAKFVLPQVDPAAPVTRYAGMLTKVTIGDYLKNELCAVSSFVITPKDEASWEIGDPFVDHPSLTLAQPLTDAFKEFAAKQGQSIKLKRAMKNKGKQTVDELKNSAKGKPISRIPRADRKKNIQTRYIMPRMCDIAIGLKVLHNEVPGNPENMVPLFKYDGTNYGALRPAEDPTGE